jgi:hypothetical protein
VRIVTLAEIWMEAAGSKCTASNALIPRMTTGKYTSECRSHTPVLNYQLSSLCDTNILIFASHWSGCNAVSLYFLDKSNTLSKINYNENNNKSYKFFVECASDFETGIFGYSME